MGLRLRAIDHKVIKLLSIMRYTNSVFVLEEKQKKHLHMQHN